ncbi:MAG: PA14 domain-containing protein [Chryseosolibacter sp.]
MTIHFTIEEAADECTASGTTLREYWGIVPGNSVSDIPVDESPTSTSQLTIFEGPQNIGTNYASRIRGYICPPTTGSYTLWIASNDHSELWLSTDDNPANKQRIAYLTRAVEPQQWDRFATQRSAPVILERGKRYYVEALHKQGIGTDHIAVGWQLPDGTFERPVSGAHLSPFEANLSSLAADTDHARSQQSSRYSEINVFPNPARSGASSLILAGYGDFKETVDTNIKIINMTGEIIYADKIFCGGDCDAYPLNPDHMTPGLYMVEMEMNGTRHSRRLVVK